MGRPVREVIPGIAGQGCHALFDRVYEMGEPFYEAEAWADLVGTGELQCRYYRTAFEPIRNAQGAVTEVLSFAVDVTAQVEARHRVQELNDALQASNAEPGSAAAPGSVADGSHYHAHCLAESPRRGA